MSPANPLQKELVRRLEEAGLPRLRGRQTLRPRDVEARIGRLVPVLVQQGPIFVALARYLSHRPDWFSWESCEKLRLARSARAPLGARDAREQFRRGLGRLPQPNELQVAWDRPHSQLFGQWHKGRTGDGAPVVVRLVDPEIVAHRATVIEVLPTLLERVPIQGPSPSRASAIRTFDQWLDREFDLPRQASVLDYLRQHRHPSDPLPARVVETLCDVGVVTHERFATADPDLSAEVRLHHWLRVALVHGVVSLDWLGEAPWLALSSGQSGITRGPFYSLDDGERTGLQNYLAAVAADDPDRACSTLESFLRGTNQSDHLHLRNGIRRIVPFRDSQWPGPPDSLGGTVIAHWRLIEASGFELDPPIERFFAGLAMQWQRALVDSPGEDPLRIANEWLRADEFLSATKRFLDPNALTSWLQSQAQPLSQLPAQLDRRLDALLLERRGSRSHEPIDSTNARGGAIGLSAALLLAAIVLLGSLLPAAGGFASWTDGALGLAIAIIGLVILRNLSKG